MIQLSRSTFRHLKTILRKTIARLISPVVIQSNADGLVVQCQQDSIAAQYQSKGQFSVENLVLPAQALTDLEGKSNDLVTLQVTNTSQIQARWQDAGVPRSLTYDQVQSPREYPQIPSRFAQQDSTLLKALDDAMQIASRDSVRFALNKIQILGRGVIIATDGHQLLWQNGFQFPWSDDVLVSRTNVFGCKDLQTSIGVAKSKTHLCIRLGNWTICLPIDTESRFPKVEGIIPSNLGSATHFTLAPSDADFLMNALPRLPANSEDLSPVTLDLNGKLLVRARADGQDQGTEIDVVGARVSGKPIRYATNRNHLVRALELGFTEGHILGVDTPMLLQDDRRKLVFQGLGKDRVIPSSAGDVRVSSNPSESVNTQPPAHRRNEPMRTPRQAAPPAPMPIPTPVQPNVEPSSNEAITNGQHNQKAGFNALLEEAQSIQNGLRDLLLRTNQLLVGLKAYRRHAKTMQSTLASLRQLQQVEA